MAAETTAAELLAAVAAWTALAAAAALAVLLATKKFRMSANARFLPPGNRKIGLKNCRRQQTQAYKLAWDPERWLSGGDPGLLLSSMCCGSVGPQWMVHHPHGALQQRMQLLIPNKSEKLLSTLQDTWLIRCGVGSAPFSLSSLRAVVM